MYKNRIHEQDTGTGNGVWETQGIEEFYILGNIAKHSGKFFQAFRRMSRNIPSSVLKHFGECRQTFPGMSKNIPGNVLEHSGEFPQTFRGMLPNISGNIPKHSAQCGQTFQKYPQIYQGMSLNTPGNVPEDSREYKFWFNLWNLACFLSKFPVKLLQHKEKKYNLVP